MARPGVKERVTKIDYRTQVGDLFEALYPDKTERAKAWRNLIDASGAQFAGVDSAGNMKYSHTLWSKIGRRLPTIAGRFSERYEDQKYEDIIVDQIRLELQDRSSAYYTDSTRRDRLDSIISQIWWNHPTSKVAQWAQREIAVITDPQNSIRILDKVNLDGKSIKVIRQEVDGFVQKQADYIKADRQYQRGRKAGIMGGSAPTAPTPPDKIREYMAFIEKYERRRGLIRSARRESAERYDPIGAKTSPMKGSDFALSNAKVIEAETVDLRTGNKKKVFRGLNEVLTRNGRLDREAIFPESDNVHAIQRAYENRIALEENTKVSRVTGDIIGSLGDMMNEMSYGDSSFRNVTRKVEYTKDMQKWVALGLGVPLATVTRGAETFVKVGYADAGTGVISIVNDYLGGTGREINLDTVFEALHISYRNRENCYRSVQTGPNSYKKELDGFRVILAAHLATIAQRDPRQAVLVNVDLEKIATATSETEAISLARAAGVTNPAELDAYKFSYNQRRLLLNAALERYINFQYGAIGDSMLKDLAGEKSDFWKAGDEVRAKHSIPKVIQQIQASLRSGTFDPMAISDPRFVKILERAMNHLDMSGRAVFDGNTKFEKVGEIVEFVPGGKAGYRIKITTDLGRVTYYEPNPTLELEARTANLMVAEALNYRMKELARDPLTTPVVWYYQFLGNAVLKTTGAQRVYDWVRNTAKDAQDWGGYEGAPKMSDLQLSKFAKNLVVKALAGPLWKTDPETGMTTPIYTYMIANSYNFILDRIVGEQHEIGLIDDFLHRLLRIERDSDGNLKDGLIKEWFWDPEKRSLIHRIWEPRIFKRLYKKKRIKDRQSILDVLLNMAIGVVSNFVLGSLTKLPIIGPAAAAIAGWAKFAIDTPGRWVGALYSKLPLDGAQGFVSGLSAPNKSFFGYKFNYAPVSDTITLKDSSGMTATMDVQGFKLQGFVSKFLGTFSRIFSQNGLIRAWNWVKLGYKMPKYIVKTVMSAVTPAIMAGIVFNSPAAFFLIGGMSLVPQVFKTMAIISMDNPSVGERFKTFKTMETLFGKKFNHLDAADLFTSSPTSKIPKFFGLEKLFYNTSIIGSKGAYSYEYTLKKGFLSKLFGNHANLRGILKGMNLASFTITIAYALTGNVAVAVAVGAGTIVGSIVYENIAAFIAEKASKYASVIRGAQDFAGGVASLTFSAAQYAIGLNFIRNMLKAMASSDPNAWNEWKQTYFTGLLPQLGTVAQLANTFASFMGITKIVAGFGRRLGFYFSRFSWFARYIPFGKWARIGALVGGLIGAVVGAIWGGAVGATVFGTIGGALGGVIGAAAATFFAVTAAALIIPLAAFAGMLIFGFGGALLGSFLENRFGSVISGAVSAFQGFYQGISTLLNLFSVWKLLSSRNLAEVAAGALTLAISGILTLTAIGNQTLTSASYVVSGGPGDDYYGAPGGNVPQNPVFISDFKKDKVEFDENHIKYVVSVSNTDPSNNDIEIKIEDVTWGRTSYAKKGNFAGDLATDFSVSTEPGTGFDISREPSQIKITEQNSTTLSTGTNHQFSITYTTTGKTMSEIIGDGSLCNKAVISGTVISTGDSFNSEYEVCVNKDGGIDYPPTEGSFGCPTSPCPAITAAYGNCNPNVKISGTNPSNPNSCDSPENLNRLYGPGDNRYLYEPSLYPQFHSIMDSKNKGMNLLGVSIRFHATLEDKINSINEKLKGYYLREQNGNSVYEMTDPKTGLKIDYEIRQPYTGCYVFVTSNGYRFNKNADGKNIWSSHAFGVACDINWDKNWGTLSYGGPGTPSCNRIDLPIELVKAFEEDGWRWGGRFNPSFDPMHFEYIESCIGEGNFGGGGGSTDPCDPNPCGEGGICLVDGQGKHRCAY